MNVAVREVDAACHRQVCCAVTALIDLSINYVDLRAHISINSRDAAAVKAHIFNRHILAVIEIDNSAGAGTHILGMACRETCNGHVIAVPENKHVCITREGFKCRCSRIGILGLDGKVAYVVDHELRTVIYLFPTVVLGAYAAIVACLGHIEILSVEYDGTVRSDGIEEFIDRRYFDFRSCRDISGCQGWNRFITRNYCIRLDVTELHGFELVSLDIVAVDIDCFDISIIHIPDTAVIFKLTAVNRRTDNIEVESALCESVICYLVGEENYALCLARVKQALCLAVVDFVVIERYACAVVGSENTVSTNIVFESDIMNITAADKNFVAIAKQDRAVAAFIDVAVSYIKLLAAGCINTDRAASVKTACIYIKVTAVLYAEDTA